MKADAATDGIVYSFPERRAAWLSTIPRFKRLVKEQMRAER